VFSQSAYAQANTANTLANSAFNSANTKLNLSGGTVTGNVTIQQTLNVQGNVTASNVYITGLYYAANGNPYTPPSVTLSDSISSNSSATAATSNAVFIAVGTALAFSIALG
jgi:hypothetical protein